jgi:hypothetical protein
MWAGRLAFPNPGRKGQRRRLLMFDCEEGLAPKTERNSLSVMQIVPTQSLARALSALTKTARMERSSMPETVPLAL